MMRVQYQIRDWGTNMIEATKNASFIDGSTHISIINAAEQWMKYWAKTKNKDVKNYTIDYIVLNKRL